MKVESQQDSIKNNRGRGQRGLFFFFFFFFWYLLHLHFKCYPGSPLYPRPPLPPTPASWPRCFISSLQQRGLLEAVESCRDGSVLWAALAEH